MASSPVRSAFHELGYGEDELLHGLPKLDFLYHRDPELFNDIVEHCKHADEAEQESWRQWFRTYPARRITEAEPDDGHLEVFRSRWYLAPLAVKIAHAAMNGSYLAVETLIGSSWQYMERTGTGWDGAKAFMIVITLMPSMGKDSDREKAEKIRYVREHIKEVEALVSEITEEGITTLERLKQRIESDKADDDDPLVDGATLDA